MTAKILDTTPTHTANSNFKISVSSPSLVDKKFLRKSLLNIHSSGIQTLGYYTNEIENFFSDYCKRKFAISFSSWTTAMISIALALNWKGKKVILPAFSFYASASVLKLIDVKIKFVDVHSKSYLIKLTEDDIKNCVGIIPVYVYGLPPDFDSITRIAKQNSIPIITDAAQAIGSSFKGRIAGSFGLAEVFSLGPLKILTAGEGGMIVTDDEELILKLKQIRAYGLPQNEDQDFCIGGNFRLSEYNAAVGVASSKKLEHNLAIRLEQKQSYLNYLRDIEEIDFQEQKEDRVSSNYTFTILLKNNVISRDEFYLNLNENGIQVRRYFYPSLDTIKLFRHEGSPSKNSRIIAKNILALPIGTHLKNAQIKKISNVSKKFILDSRLL